MKKMFLYGIRVNEKVQLFFLFFVCLFTFLPGIGTPNNDFILDDQVAIMKNTDVTNISRSLFDSLGLIMEHDFWGQNLFNKHSHKSYRPVVTMLYHLEHRMYENLTTIAPAMRANSMAIHYTVCVALKYVLLWLMPELLPSISSMAALMFAVHPIHTELICHIVGRADIVCGLFFLIAVMNYSEMMTVRNQYLALKMIPVGLMGLICMFSKEIGIVALPFCAVLDIIDAFGTYPPSRVPARRNLFYRIFNARRGLYMRIIYLAVITLLLAIIRFSLMNFEFPSFNMEENPIANHPSFIVRALTYPYIHFIHFWLLICPDWLCFDWSHNSLAPIESFSDPRIIPAIILYLYLIGLFIKGPRPIRIAVALIVIPFIPSSNLFSIGFVVAERVLYIPAMGYCLLISIGFHFIYVNVKMPIAFMTTMVLIVSVLVFRTQARSSDYVNEFQYYLSGLRVNPQNAKINYNIAEASFRRADFDRAYLYGLKANKLRPNHINTLNNLANACRRLNKHELALEYLHDAVRIWPGYSLGWMNLGITYSVLHKYSEALNAYSRAEEITPNNDKVLYNFGVLYQTMGNQVMAGKMYKRARDANPERFYAQKNYLLNRAEHGTFEEILEACDHIEEHKSDDTELMLLVADILSRKNHDSERVISILKDIIHLKPEDSEAHLKLSLEYRKTDPTIATKYFERALQLNPNYAAIAEYSDLLKLVEENRKEKAKTEMKKGRKGGQKKNITGLKPN